MSLDASPGDLVASHAGNNSASGLTRAAGNALPVSSILAICDRLVEEAGRRSHMFGWLRLPSGDAEQWLKVDSYYPGNRLVVICRSQPEPHDALYRERVPEHGLRLLELDPTTLGGSREQVEASLTRLIAEVGPTPRRAREAPVAVERERPVASAMASLAPEPPPETVQRRVGQSHAAAAERGARFLSTHPGARAAKPSGSGASASPGGAAASRRLGSAPARPVPRRPPREQPDVPQIETLGVVLGLTIVAVASAEVFLGVAKFGLGDGHVLLAFGLALDACARTVGAIAAARAGEHVWAWLSALGGSPFVASFALFRPSGPVKIDPAPLAGLISIAATSLTVIGILAAAAGS